MLPWLPQNFCCKQKVALNPMTPLSSETTHWCYGRNTRFLRRPYITVGHNFLKKHKSVTFEFGGPEEALIVKTKADTDLATLPAANADPPSLFEFMKADCKPIACRTHTYSKDDLAFIESEVEKCFLRELSNRQRLRCVLTSLWLKASRNVE